MVTFSGTVASDFLKLVKVEDNKKSTFINYADTDFYSLRDSLISYIKAVYPLDYNNFVESDLGVMLIELIAYMGSVVAYKSDYLAHENFLRTAKSRESVKKLLELIGVRLKGPIAAAANAKATLEEEVTWTSNNDSVTISAANRVIQIESPEDGSPLNFTLYKITPAGNVQLDNGVGSIALYPNENTSGLAFSNLALLEGALVVEQGAFDSTESVKTVQLSRSPVIEGSITVIIEGDEESAGVYRQVENVYFASGPGDKVFQITTDDNFNAVVVFADPFLGMAPSQTDTYKIYYRVGGGSRGNIVNEYINVTIPVSVSLNGTPSTNNFVVENVSQATGGANAETAAHAKKYAPLTFRRQDRLVTLLDYQGFVNTFISSYGSTGKATVSVRRAYSSANIIDVFVLEKASDTQLRKATPEFKTQLLQAMQEKKMITDEPVVVDGLVRTLELILTVRCDSIYRLKEQEILTKVKNAVTEYFNTDNVDFGEEFIPQDLNKKLFEIPEVRFVTVDNYPNPVTVEFNEIIQLNNFTINMVFI